MYNNYKQDKLIKKDRQTCGIDIVGHLIMDVMQPKPGTNSNIILSDMVGLYFIFSFLSLMP